MCDLLIEWMNVFICQSIQGKASWGVPAGLFVCCMAEEEAFFEQFGRLSVCVCVGGQRKGAPPPSAEHCLPFNRPRTQLTRTRKKA